MRFFILTSLVLTASAVAVTKVPDKYDPDFCDHGTALCDMATTFEDCSNGYIKFMEACMATGCIQWFDDPLRHCRKSPK
ncbi:Similar to hypothetical protein [Tuber melanosporum Mel28]; acc. no. XP_002836506 [Pyronema omphalodes CBS 100304]|uniref:Uncharacterized protein n=1 Tax=Pyronema omphalodes (strain CBS 100304) TaxID=1076935 RepID=U4L1Z7_PYROM|nr:Similar to hypothetical protein [Tuber melanosporum Mel28]; acc. no. XP_002836506 [Pyronema omphalodes CBS 100304]